MSTPTNNKRIELIDALRGFALMGILLLHSVEHFSFMQEAEKNPEVFHAVDSYVNGFVTFLFSGKAFTIFSLMFGFSFYTIINNNLKKGIDFRGQFAWRLVVLFLFGYIYSAILLGEILTIYALLGIPLIFLFNLNKKVLLWLAILYLIQIPTIIRVIMSYWDTDFNYDWETVGALFGEAFQVFGEGSFLEVAEFNLWKGHKAIWLWAFYQG
ncbi:hypothetical protein KO566_03600 [Flavobacteriaceae bacterium XHP0103]|uniref:DUF418 domain-containing protein n=1 Tax=Marixanthotalea marina TaxID=2844359 RepID=UPI002989DEEA|nr:hypothetical protein [Marixanthotalea marina]MBU3821134.1 hypothetical protein [Marixanthotalea marina]